MRETCPMLVPTNEAIEAEIQRLSPAGHYPETPSGMTTQQLMRHMAQFALRESYPLCKACEARSARTDR